MKKIIFFVGSTLFASFFFGSVVSAQEDTSLRLITSPLPINLVVEPGETISTELKIKNDGIREEKLTISLLKFRAYQDSGQPELLEPEAGDEFLSWVSFSEPEFVVAPNEWKTIIATFTVPASAAFGYYYAPVFSRAEEREVQTRETAIIGGTAVLILLEVSVPGAVRSVSLESFSPDRSFYEFLPTSFRVALKNTGNVHVAVRGNIFIEQGSNKEVSLLEVNPEKRNILPDSTRTFAATWTDGFPRYVTKLENGQEVKNEEGNTESELEWNWNDASSLRIGKYSAKILLIYDDGTRDVPLEATTSFWVVPWRLLGGLLFILLFFFIGLRSTFINLYRKFFRRKNHEA